MKFTVNYNSHELIIKETFLNYISYEQLTGHSFEPKGLTDILQFMFCTFYVAAHDLDLVITWKDFIAFIDEYPEVVSDFENWLLAIHQKNTVLLDNIEELSDVKKKKKTKKTTK